jgi:hypothetical protein
LTTTPCRECGLTLPTRATGRPATFCSTACRLRWHNRRKERGTQLYDFIMGWRFEREQPDNMAQLARLASAYRDADNSLRAGRKSWNTGEAQTRLPIGFGTDGDKR